MEENLDSVSSLFYPHVLAGYDTMAQWRLNHVYSKTECMSLIEEPGSWFYTIKQIYEIFDMKWSGIKPEKHD